MSLAQIELFLFDIDGVFLAGKSPARLVAGTEILSALRGRNLPLRLVTNTSTHPRTALAETLAGVGIEIAPHEIHSALTATVEAATRCFPRGTCYVVGEPGLAEAAAERDLRLVDDAPADVVLVGLSRFVDYAQLSAATRCLLGGAALLGCHRNKTWLDDAGARALSCGPWLAALEYASGVRAESFGKPSEAFYREAVRGFDVAPEHVLMTGDDLVGDIGGAQRLGLKTALVLSGKTSRDDLARSDIEPDLVLENVDALAGLLR